MSLRLEMIQVARLAPKLLGESAELVEAYVRGQQNPDGGFRDRDGNSDLYIHDLRSGLRTRLTRHPAADEWPDWSPDGRSIVFSSSRFGKPSTCSFAMARISVVLPRGAPPALTQFRLAEPSYGLIG